MNWADYPNFSEAEFRCKFSGKCQMNPEFMARLQRLRTAWGRPMGVTSGFRDRTHQAERNKATPGAHTLGRAVDIGIQGPEAFELLAMALVHGFTGLGVKQHGSGRFLHLDDITQGLPRPALWSYP